MAKEINLHEVAVREGYRFPSVRGELTVENLWQLPLTGNDGCNLDVIAVALDDQVEGLGKKSFIKAVSKDDQVLKNKLELVKYIIDTKLAEKQAEAEANTKAIKAKQLRLLLAEKQAEATKELSIEEIQAQLAELES